GERGVLPSHPAAILGTCFHSVLAAANDGSLTGEGESAVSTARSLFDQQANILYEKAHPLVRAKFSTVDRLPYYNLHRESAALHAEEIIAADQSSQSSRRHSTTYQRERHTEERFTSKDGLLVGRPDHLDGARRTVIDYKTGIGPEGADN